MRFWWVWLALTKSLASHSSFLALTRSVGLKIRLPTLRWFLICRPCSADRLTTRTELGWSLWQGAVLHCCILKATTPAQLAITSHIIFFLDPSLSRSVTLRQTRAHQECG